MIYLEINIGINIEIGFNIDQWFPMWSTCPGDGRGGGQFDC